MAFAILRAEKLKTMGILGSFVIITEPIDTPNANPSQTPNNFHSLKDSEAVKAAISERLPEKGVLMLFYVLNT